MSKRRATRYYTDEPFFYGEFEYQITCVETGVSSRQAWYYAILDIQNYLGWTHWCELPNMGSHIFTKGIFYNPIKIVRVGIAPYENQTYPFKNQEEAKRVRQKIEKACESEAIKFDPDEAQKGNAILREIFCNF